MRTEDTSSEGSPQNGPRKGGPNYRIEVAGVLGWGAEEWFADAIIEPLGDRTVLNVSVTDQSALHGILRRIHDLHLQLLSVLSIESDQQSPCEDMSS